MWKDASKAVEAAEALKNKLERQSHALANKMDKAAEAIKQYNLEWLKLQDDLEAASRSLAKAKQDKEALLQMASDKDAGAKHPVAQQGDSAPIPDLINFQVQPEAQGTGSAQSEANPSQGQVNQQDPSAIAAFLAQQMQTLMQSMQSMQLQMQQLSNDNHQLRKQVEEQYWGGGDEEASVADSYMDDGEEARSSTTKRWGQNGEGLPESKKPKSVERAKLQQQVAQAMEVATKVPQRNPRSPQDDTQSTLGLKPACSMSPKALGLYGPWSLLLISAHFSKRLVVASL